MLRNKIIDKTEISTVQNTYSMDRIKEDSKMLKSEKKNPKIYAIVNNLDKYINTDNKR